MDLTRFRLPVHHLVALWSSVQYAPFRQRLATQFASLDDSDTTCDAGMGGGKLVGHQACTRDCRSSASAAVASRMEQDTTARIGNLGFLHLDLRIT